MAKVCSVCSLPTELLEVVEAKLAAGVTQGAISGWLGEKGYPITSNMLTNHKRNHLNLTPGNTSDQPENPASHVQLNMSSGELIKANLQDAIALSQQLQALNQPCNLRVSRVLVEHLSNLHRMLTEVSFEGDSHAS